MLMAFMTGAIVALYLVAGVFFLKFWRRTQDKLFLAFAIAFTLEGLNRVRFLFVEHPNEASVSIYAVRLLAFLIIAAAIIRRNLGDRRT